MLGVGCIEDEADKCTYTVTRFEDIISVIIPIFTFTKLFTQKYLDFFRLYRLKRNRVEKRVSIGILGSKV